MNKASFIRIFIKDVIDFVIIAIISLTLTLGIYMMLPSFTKIEWSFYFFEMNLELFFMNPKLVFWLLGMAFGVTLIYFLFGAMLHGSTFGGLLTRITLVDNSGAKSASMTQIFAMACGAYLGVLALFIGPLYAWWIDSDTRGLAERMGRTRFLKIS